MSLFTVCPCGSQMLHQECCGRYHTGVVPENALILMRSRYSAYALGNVDYVIDTTHPKSPVRTPNLNEWKKELREFCQDTKFERLEIVEFIDGAQNASVTFTAHLKQGGRPSSFTERSTFAKEQGRWFYKDGKLLKTK